MPPLSEWYKIRYDDLLITLDVRPEGAEPWTAEISWSQIERVCFEKGEFLASDTIYVFVIGRDHSYAIPTEGDGGAELWGAIVKRGLFDAQLAIDVMTNEESIVCWPPIPDQHDQS